MSFRRSYLYSTIGSKCLIGVSGLLLAAFLLIHMLGNILILAGPEKYNYYSYKLVSNPFLPLAEIGLVIFFLIHVVKAMAITWRNRKAKPQGYAVTAKSPKGTTPVSKTLIFQGVVIFVFVILHLITFKYGTHYEVQYDGVTMRDLYKLVIEVFHKPGYVIWYMLALLILALHLGHGVYASFQTMGISHPKYMPTLKRISMAFTVIVSAGFLILPVYVYFLT